MASKLDETADLGDPGLTDEELSPAAAAADDDDDDDAGVAVAARVG